MFKLDEEILRAYFRLEECQSQRIRFERLLHPEKMKWSKDIPNMSEAKMIRIDELGKMGFGENYYRQMADKEKEAKDRLEGLARDHLLHGYMEPITGFGDYLVGAFIAAGGDITKPPTVSSFWKGMGLDIVDGKAPRKVRTRGKLEEGVRRYPALPHVTRIGEQIRQQMLRQNPFYQELYYSHKDDYGQRYPDSPKMFAHKHGLRIGQKILYSCLWKQWRLCYALPVSEPYVYDMLKHDDGRIITLDEFYRARDHG